MPLQEWSEHIWLVKLGDEPGLSDDLAAARGRAEAAASTPDVILDLAGVSRLNSSHLSQMLRLRQALLTRDRRLRLAAPSDAAWALFLVTGVDKVFDFAPDVATALAALQMPR